MNKKMSAIIIVIVTISIISITIFISYNLKNMNISKGKVNDSQNLQMKVGEDKKTNEEIILTNVNQTKISPNAIIIFKKHYKKCNHTILEKEKVSDNMVNLSEEEFSNLYSNWKISKFTSNEIELSKEFEGECEKHYLIRENNNYINIYKIEEDGNLTLFKETDISTKYLPETDIKNLTDGITLVGDEELNLFIENFE